MCEPNAYVLKDGEEELLLESVNFFEDRQGRIRLVNLFGEECNINADIQTISLVDHKILLRPA